MTTAWRPARLDDVVRIARLSNSIHTLFPEREEVFAEKIRLSPEGCHVLESDDAIVGYILSHPWRRRSPSALDSLIGELPAEADCWYVHDLGMGAGVRGTGAATEIAGRIIRAAEREKFPVVALVAVAGADGYWRKLGFQEVAADGLAAKLREYGEDAVYMELPLGAAGAPRP
ncbi:GNAT family N-acetyltransferase [Thalassobaculum sp.]|uniref:GNAT family N-acetyltransferase n=1 Tax=Thalassobaculum sp. TaxID=2022740 RepID=UPI0032EB80E8